MSSVTAAAVAVRQLVLLVAAVCLLGTGTVELAPRSLTANATAAGAPAVTSVGRATPSRPAAESGAPSTSLTLRSPLAAFSPGSGGAPAMLPGACPLVAPHLVVRPGVRPPTSGCALTLPGGPSERAPPVLAGT